MRLEDIDFEAVEKCSDVSVLEKYIKLLSDDGGFFPELLESCKRKIYSLNPAKMQNKKPTDFEIENSRETLLNWETELRKGETEIAFSEKIYSVRGQKCAEKKSVSKKIEILEVSDEEVEKPIRRRIAVEMIDE